MYISEKCGKLKIESQGRQYRLGNVGAAVRPARTNSIRRAVEALPPGV